VKPDENTLSYESMMGGFIDATGRFRDATGRRDADAASSALSEALDAAVRLEDWIRKHWIVRGQALGWSWREMLPMTELMPAIRFVRGRVHHQFADAAAVRERTYPYKFPLLAPEWAWRPAEELPPPDLGHPDRHGGEAAYRKLLEGRPVQVGLDALCGVFYTVQRIQAEGDQPTKWVGPRAG
jgi:hypothetical protein